jgi:hypothetical protein
MVIEQGIWKIGDQSQQLKPAALADESLLENMVMKDVAILNPDWLLIGRQVRTSYDKLIDLLAVDANGSIIIVELKRQKTPRDVVAQAIDYASWVVKLSDSDIVDIYLGFAEKYQQPPPPWTRPSRPNSAPHWPMSPSTTAIRWLSSQHIWMPARNASSTTSTTTSRSPSTLCFSLPSKTPATSTSAAPG